MTQQIIIFGANGMLGTYLSQYLCSRYQVIRITRSEYDIMVHNWTYLEELLLKHKIDQNTIVINAIGTIPQAAKNHALNNTMYIKINSIFPNILAMLCDKYHAHMIHSTTDCVFDGLKGIYKEDDNHTASDIYGITKSLGEPTSCTVIRTSIIGEECINKRSLLEWVRSTANGNINGYVNHYWNGITCLQYAKIVDQIIENNMFWQGVRHIFSPKSVTKYELVSMMNEIYQLDIVITEYATDETCDRSLMSNYDMLFEIPDLEQQIVEMEGYVLHSMT